MARRVGKWQVLDKFDFKQHGKVQVEGGCLLLSAGEPATGVRWTGDFPKMDTNSRSRRKRVEGTDFFCGLTFPVGDKAHDVNYGRLGRLARWPIVFGRRIRGG